MSVLVGYNRTVVASLSDRQQQSAESREAERLGISRDAWREIRASTVSLELLRTIHVAGTGRPSNVRRADEDGTWTIVPPKPGRLRSRPQSFRIGDHVERAWDHNTLRKQLAELLRTAMHDVGDRPFDACARIAWNLLRAQPFLGLNERTALLFAARLLHGVGLPTLHVIDLERDDELAAAATMLDHTVLAEVLERAVWREALDFAEWLALPPQTARWSLRDEQEALANARGRIATIDAHEIDDSAHYLAESVREALTARLAMPVEPCVITTSETEEERLTVALASARSGRFVCPRRPIVHLRWPVSSSHGLVARIVIGSAGRGLTGAVSMNLALDVGGVAARTAPAMLLVPGESTADRRQRMDAWVARAIPRAVTDCPLRC